MEMLRNLGIKQKFLLCSLLPVVGMGSAMAIGGNAVGLVAAILVAAGLFLAWDFANDLENLLVEGKALVKGLANQNYSVSVTRNAGGEFGQLLYSLSNLAKSLKRQKAEGGGTDESTAQKIAAVDVANTSIMIADNDLNITYVNKAVVEMLTARETELKQKIPAFDANSLVGTCVDSFHVNPSHQRNMINNLKEAYITDLPLGELTFGLIATPLMNEKGQRIGTIVEWDDKTDRLAAQEKLDAVSRENLAIRNALDVCNTSVMMADADLNITYMNQAVRDMLKEAEPQLRTALPNFRTDQLMGTCVDDFHANPAHQRTMLGSLRETYKTDLPLAGFTFGLIATPLFDEAGERLGTVVEWDNKTERLAEQEKLDVISRENLAIRNALDVCNTSVMMADADLNITYMNNAVKDMLKQAEPQLQTELPNFRADNLIGTCVDDFHKNPAHQRGLLGKLTDSYQTDLPLAGFTFGLIATPLYAEDGTRLGTVVEWDNKTDRLAKVAQEAKVASDNLRIRQALDVCDTAVMLGDNDLNIIYMNNAVNDMMRGKERDIQKSVPNFRSDSLMGTCVDDFHKNPQYQRSLLRDLRSPHHVDLELGDSIFGLIATPLLDNDNNRLGTVIEWNDKTDALAKEREERKISEENARIKQALDVVGTSAMLADNDLNIIYMNNAVMQMMREAQNDLRKDLPNFNADGLMGTCVDMFHKNPSHQRGMITALNAEYATEIVVGGRTFALKANPIKSNAGERLGTVVEWVDRTAEVAIEKEIDNLVEAAASGDFTQSVEESGKDGFFLRLTQGLNQLVSTANVGINDVVRVLDAISKGDLTEEITADYSGSFAQLKQYCNSTTGKLTEVVGKIRNSAGQISSGANEIAQGNADLSQRTEEQASSLEETASSMEEMTSTVKQSADNAGEANNLAQMAQGKAAQGGEVVSRAVQAMDAINKSSKEIADIIVVIDEIAFQTNLLALNAAVEAARAGEQGRGFAVVAGEVRNLAGRSATAAKEIKDLIRDSEVKVNEGTELVNESGTTLNEIVDAVQKVSDMIADISTASQEQTEGISQVNTAISQMDEMTQQNAALVEEASAAGESMAEQAKNMTQLLEFFHLDAHHAPQDMAAAPPSFGNYTAPTPINSRAASGGGSSSSEWEEF